MPRLPKATRIACIPVRTAHKPPIKFDHFPAVLHPQNAFYGLRRAIQSSANPAKPPAILSQIFVTEIS